jgi:GH24 family phage-related lysozyme (muramidase)
MKYDEQLTFEERQKNKLRQKEGQASDHEKYSEYTGLKGKPNTRVRGSTAHGLYYDSKGYLTAGTGHLVKSEAEAKSLMKLDKKGSEKLLDEDVNVRVNQISKKIKDFQDYRPDLQDALFSSWYRGSLPGSPKTIEKINRQNYVEASKEFLDNQEYRQEKKKGSGIARRMEETAKELKKQGAIKAKGQYLFGLPKQEEPKKQISRGPASMSIEKIEEEEKKLDAAARANLLKQNKEEVIQSLVERQDLSDDEKLKAAKFLDNDKEVLKSAERTAGLRPKQSGLAAQFKDALTFFAPQLIGGAIAQSIEGTDEAFVAGFQQAGTMRDSYNKYKQDLADLALRERGAVRAPKGFQQTDYVTQDGQPATFDPNTGKYKTQDGKVVNPRELKNSISARQEQNLQRADERIALSKSQFTQQLQKDSQLSDTQIKQIGDFENSLKSVAEIDRLFTDAETGPVIGRVQSLQQLADASPDVFNKLKAEAAAAKLAYQKATSGLQVNEREIEMIASILPNENDAPGVFKSKLDVFKRIVTAHKDSFMQAIKTGQPLKAEVVEDIARQTSQITPENKKEQVDIQKQLDIIKKIKAGRR